ncbi:SDR family oxidoreductase [Desulfopila sp. IMCC35006]|uniref:SDR family oxidoreductase n=1 Tax=Desulfopila sp. IMCC35006 TaxID=2569542 RepID=UPI0010AC3FA2|nr:SDR family oxidoreductase [Desulfopila sp. IMCC35006]TKB25026.1 SDR family oxidoreductase [Desulfopila sp. IMCC35006]
MAKTILITGATSGFGKAAAELFSSNGWKLILTGRRRDRLQELQEKLGAANVHIAVFDVRDRQQVEAAIQEIPREFQDIDILLNNAGLALGLGPAQEADLDEWETMVDTNIKGLLYMTRRILPMMVARGTGHVINLGSVAGSWPYPGGNTYGATKAFVQQFSRNLRTDLQGTGIRVTNIEPGLAESEFSIVRFGGDAEKAAKVYEGTRPLTPVDIAEIIYWTASRPAHVNINCVEVMPVCQSWGNFSISRDSF